MGRLLKLLLLLAVAGMLALTIYAYLGDIAPEVQQDEQVLTLPIE